MLLMLVLRKYVDLQILIYVLTGGRGRADEEMSELSEESGKDWKPDMTGKLAWLHRCAFPQIVLSFIAYTLHFIFRAMGRGEDPRRLLEAVLPKGSFVPPDIDRITLWKVCIITI